MSGKISSLPKALCFYLCDVVLKAVMLVCLAVMSEFEKSGAELTTKGVSTKPSTFSIQAVVMVAM